MGTIVAIGSKGGEYKILKDDESDFTKSFLDSFKTKLGPRAEEIILEDREKNIDKDWQKLKIKKDWQMPSPQKKKKKNKR